MFTTPFKNNPLGDIIYTTIYKHTQIYKKQKQIYTNIHTYTQMYTNIHTYIQIYTHIYTNMYTNIHTHIQIQSNIHTHTQIYKTQIHKFDD